MKKTKTRTLTPLQVHWRFHKARERLVASIELRKKMLETAYHGQLHAEKVNIEGHIGRLQPGVRKVYLEKRLAELNKVL